MYEIDPKPNSDQVYCSNCENIVEKNDIRETIDGKSGCIDCVSVCLWCGNHYLNEDLYSNPYLGYVCDACKNAEDYMKASEEEIEKDALRLLFDDCIPSIEPLIIDYVIKKGYMELAQEMKNDLKR